MRPIQKIDPSRTDEHSASELAEKTQTHGEFSEMDTVDLVDVALVFWKRKFLIFGCMVLGFVSGFSFGVTRPQLSTFTTSVEVARATGGLVEQPANILAKLNQGYIPLIIDRYRREKGVASSNVSVRIPSGSDILVIENSGHASEKAFYEALHQTIVERLASDHDQLLGSEKQAIEARRRTVQSTLEELIDEARFIQASLARVSEKEKLLERQIQAVRELILAQQKSREQAANEVTGEAKALTLLLVDNEIQQHQERLAALEDRLLIGITQEKDDLEKTKGDNLRAQETTRASLLELSQGMERMKRTQAIAPMVEGVEGARASPVIFGFAGIIAGFVAGIFLVICAQFFWAVRIRASSLN